MLTANDTDPDIVEGLQKGADDYITKPFSLSVLRARIETQLRRAKVVAASKVQQEIQQKMQQEMQLEVQQAMQQEMQLEVQRGVPKTNQDGQLKRDFPSDIYRIGNYVFDFPRMIFTVKGQVVELSKTEQKTLRILVENRGITVDRERMIDLIWTDGAEFVEDNALSVTIKRLRDKLNAGQYIKTVYGVGYTWEKTENQ
ncbi:MAG: response regulator transcription factor [Lachnospiraceae bacterium]|nr:response regulator transcription factor [Lachnospiraceae bacterium]